jgi:hypothetical protein
MLQRFCAQLRYNPSNGTMTVGGTVTLEANESAQTVQIIIVPEDGGTAYTVTANIVNGTFRVNAAVAAGNYKVYAIVNITTTQGDATTKRNILSPVSQVDVTGGQNPKPPKLGTITPDNGKPRIVPGANPPKIESSGTVSVEPGRQTDTDKIEITIVPNNPANENTTKPPIESNGRPSTTGGTFTGTSENIGRGPYTVLIRITFTINGVKYHVYAKPVQLGQ